MESAWFFRQISAENAFMLGLCHVKWCSFHDSCSYYFNHLLCLYKLFFNSHFQSSMICNFKYWCWSLAVFTSYVFLCVYNGFSQVSSFLEVWLAEFSARGCLTQFLKSRFWLPCLHYCCDWFVAFAARLQRL